jgi:hypothetical protein
VGGQVAEEEDTLVEMVNDVRLVANEVAQSIGSIRVDEAVSDPLARLYPILIRTCPRSTENTLTSQRPLRRDRKPLPHLHHR